MVVDSKNDVFGRILHLFVMPLHISIDFQASGHSYHLFVSYTFPEAFTWFTF